MYYQYFIYIKASGYNCGSVEKLSKITIEQINEYIELINLIKKYKEYNFTFRTELVKNENLKSGWESEYVVYKMYPNISKKTINKFMKYVPAQDIDHIEEIKILTTTEINIEDIK
jgi:hypothetical protein